AGASTREIGEVFVFAVAEELLELAREALDAELAGCSANRRAEGCGVIVGVRHAPSSDGSGNSPLPAVGKTEETGDGTEVWLTLGRRGGTGRSWTFAVAGARPLAEAVIAFGRALSRTLLRHHPAHRYNLRLCAFRDSLRKLAEQVRELSREDAKVNPTPDAYRLVAGGAPAGTAQSAPLLAAG